VRLLSVAGANTKKAKKAPNVMLTPKNTQKSRPAAIAHLAPRANWKGYLRLSLVSCPIALYPASSLSEKVSFNRLNRKTGNRLKQQNVDSETSGVVPREDIARGYEVAKGQYLIVEDQELDAVQIESTRTMDIDQFVPKSEI
jgi:DNA end-binding protein Ku